jgi:hypothetical protein
MVEMKRHTQQKKNEISQLKILEKVGRAPEYPPPPNMGAADGISKLEIIGKAKTSSTRPKIIFNWIPPSPLSIYPQYKCQCNESVG